MPETPFFRLLKTPLDAKGEGLAAQIAALNASSQAEETFTLDPDDFRLIPGSPFAYWVGDPIRSLFTTLQSMAESGTSVQHGASTKNDFRFLRLWCEVAPEDVGEGLRWAAFAKGGAFSPYYASVHLLVHWENEAQEIHEYLVKRYPYLQGNSGWVLHPENTYFRPGLTWSARTTSGISPRALPAGCVFGHKGPAVFVSGDNCGDLLALLAVMNSTAFEALVKLQLGAATAAARSYEVGIIQRTPIPPLTDRAARDTLASLAREAHDLQRDRDRTDETAHTFCLPRLVRHRTGTLREVSLTLDEEAQHVASRLAAIRAEIDDVVFGLYGLGEADRALVRSEMGQPPAEDSEPPISEAEDEEEEPPSTEDLPVRVQDLLMWCVGVAFGRWDVRMALDPTLLPALQGPFDLLPRCAPGALVGTDGLPPATAAGMAPESWLRARDTALDLPSFPGQGQGPGAGVEYPLSIAWDGILVDDPTHPADVVACVRGVLELLWGDHAGAVEREASEILGVKSLRDYFRDPRGFFAFHIRRYSKSRRKAPIYWLLQSEKRSYGLWLYLHRLTPMTLYVAARDFADPKVALEQDRLKELRDGLQGLGGSALRRREAEIEHQDKLVAEVTAFRKRLDAVALLNLPPDPNDGVVISIAPLHELVPWKEAQRTWDTLVAGEYPWSTMAKQMRDRGIVLK